MKRGLFSLVIGLMSAAGFADMIVTLDSSGALWKADTANVNGAKTLLATLTGGALYIDSAFDGQYLYGLRNDGTVYRSDLSGNVSAVSLTGWSSSIVHINADSGTLYGMKNSTTPTILDVSGNVAVNFTGSGTWSDFTVTDNGIFWMLLTSANGGCAWAYGFTNGFSGTFGGQSGYVNFGVSGKVGFALDSAGTELYAAYTNGANHAISRAPGIASNSPPTVLVDITPVVADIATGTDFYAAKADGTIVSTPLTSGIPKTTLGTLSGAGTVGLEVVPRPGYAGWAAGWGTNIGAEADDYDGDGLPNLYEYGLGGDPTHAADQGTSPVFGVENDGGTNWFVYVHPQLSDANSGLSYFVELNTDLVSGFWTPFGCTVAATNTTGGVLDFVTHVIDMVDDQKYMRLSILKTDSAAALRALILKNRPLPLTHLNVAAHLDVADFGAVPDDGQNDRAAVSAAIAQAKSMAGPVQIDFDPGAYDFFPTAADYSVTLGNTAIPFFNSENLILDGHGAEIVIHRQDVPFVLAYTSTNLIIRNFSIDYDPLPFSQGTVQSINSADGSFVFELQAGFPPPDDPFFKSCDSWGMLKDQEHPGRLKADCPQHFYYSAILALGSNLFHVALADTNQISNFEPGDAFVINGRSAGIGYYFNSDNITFDHLTIYACPSALFLGAETSRLNILNCRAELKGNRLITAGADGVHCQAARIGPWVENCDFEGLSDDGLNIYGLPIYVLEQISPTQLTVYARAPIQSGDQLVFFNPNEGRIILETTVASFSGSTLVLNDPLNEPLNIAPSGTPLDECGWKIYDHAYNLDAVGSHFVYRNNTMHDGRRYGVFIKASDGLIENNVFEGLSSTGIAVLNTPSWPEGFWAQNLVIQSNRVSECGYAGPEPPAVIASKKLGITEMESPMTPPMQKNIFLLNNKFNAVAGLALMLSGVDGLVAEGNEFSSGSESGPLVTVQYSENVTWTNNLDQGRVEFK